jgi:hypothetical protein
MTLRAFAVILVLATDLGADRMTSKTPRLEYRATDANVDFLDDGSAAFHFATREQGVEITVLLDQSAIRTLAIRIASHLKP